MMESLEVAVLSLFSSSTHIPKNEALTICHEFEKSDDSWKICCHKIFACENDVVIFYFFKVLVDKVNNIGWKERMEVREATFKFLSEKYVKKNEYIIMQKTFLLNNNNADCRSLQQLKNNIADGIDSAIRSKIALLFLKLIELDYFTHWNTAFHDLVNFLKSFFESRNFFIFDFFLKFLIIFHEEIVEFSMTIPSNHPKKSTYTNLKDMMRNNDVKLLASVWYDFLQCFAGDICLALMENAGKSDETIITAVDKSIDSFSEKIICDCLLVISKFVSWIDLSLIANMEFISIFAFYFSPISAITTLPLSFLPNNIPSTASLIKNSGKTIDNFIVSYSIKSNVCKCIGSIVTKRMHFMQKMNLLRDIQIAEFIKEYVHNTNSSGKNYGEDQDYTALLDQKIELFCAIGDESLDIFVNSQDFLMKYLENKTIDNSALAHDEAFIMHKMAATDSRKILENVLLLIFNIFSTSEISISVKFEAFIFSFFSKIKNFTKSDDRLNRFGDAFPLDIFFGVDQICANLLQIILCKMEFPSWFDLKNKDTERHEKFIALREEMIHFFRCIVNLDPVITTNYISEILRRITNNRGEFTENQIEVILTVLYLIGENDRCKQDVEKKSMSSSKTKPVKNSKVSENDKNAGLLATCFNMVIMCNHIMKKERSNCNFRLSLLKFLVRYFNLTNLSGNNQSLAFEKILDLLLHSISSDMSNDPIFISKSASYFLKFVKSNINFDLTSQYSLYILESLSPYLYISKCEIIDLNSLSPEMDNKLLKSENQIDGRFESNLILYECVGELIGHLKLPSNDDSENADKRILFSSINDRKIALRAILERLLLPLHDLSVKKISYLDTKEIKFVSDQNEEESVPLVFYYNHLLAINRLLKGFVPSVTNYFQEELDIVSQAIIRATPILIIESPRVREAIFGFCRDSIIFSKESCIHNISNSFNYFYNLSNSQDRLISIKNIQVEEHSKNIIILIYLLSQLKHRFILDFLAPNFHRLLDVFLNTWISIPDDSPELRREKNQLQSKLCQLINSINNTNISFLFSILTDEKVVVMIDKTELNQSTNFGTNCNNNQQVAVVVENLFETTYVRLNGNNIKLSTVLIDFLVYTTSLSSVRSNLSALSVVLQIFIGFLTYIMENKFLRNQNFDSAEIHAKQESFLAFFQIIRVIDNCSEVLSSMGCGCEEIFPKAYQDICNFYQNLISKSKALNFYFDFENLILLSITRSLNLQGHDFKGLQHLLHDISSNTSNSSHMKELLRKFITEHNQRK